MRYIAARTLWLVEGTGFGLRDERGRRRGDVLARKTHPRSTNTPSAYWEPRQRNPPGSFSLAFPLSPFFLALALFGFGKSSTTIREAQASEMVNNLFP